MENPSTWNDVQKTIFEATQQADRDFVANRVGHSFVTYIYNALKLKGYLKEEVCLSPDETSIDTSKTLALVTEKQD